MLTKKDVCIVIATYNRPDDVKRTLSMLRKNSNVPGKIIVIDQSKDTKTKEIVLSFEKKLPVTYRYSQQPSSSIAKNMGILEGKREFPLILILDDDVDLLPGYFINALKELNADSKIMGLGGVDISKKIHKSSKGLKSFIFKLFLLPHQKDNDYSIISPYGNTADPEPTKPVRNAQWLPGFNMLFRREIFKNYKMPESKGYNVLEDIDSSYYTFLKYGSGSLVVTPACKADHRFSLTSRYAERKRIFVNHEDHFYFYYTYLHTPLNAVKLWWSLFGIIVGQAVRLLARPTKNNYLALKYNLQAIAYACRNRKRIRKGKLRDFLNPDLSMKDPLPV